MSSAISEKHLAHPASIFSDLKALCAFITPLHHHNLSAMALTNLPFEILTPIISFTLPNNWYEPEHRQWTLAMRLVCRKFNDIVSDSAFHKIEFDLDLPEKAQYMSDGIAVCLLARMAARNPESNIGIIKSMHLGAESIAGAITANGLQVGKQAGEYGRHLHAAAAAATLYLGRAGAIRRLVRPRYNDGWTEGSGNSLAAAAISGNEEVVRYLIKNGADINACHKYFGVAICAAAFSGCHEVVKLLLDAGADGDMPGGYNIDGPDRSALTIAAGKRNVGLMQLLLDMGCDVEGENQQGYGPLFMAISRGHEEAIILLMEYGADPTRKVYGYTPFDLAAMLGEERIVRLLIPHVKTHQGSNLILCSALQKAARRGQEGMVRLLLRAGINIHPGTHNWRSYQPHSDSFYLENITMVRFLFEAGADLEERNESDLTPLQSGIEPRHEAIANLLREAGVNLTVTHFSWHDPILPHNRRLRWETLEGDECIIGWARGPRAG
ncbi:MAG: hypothetical protein M1839_005944 [Geoglossum umbratile]|nr:MAG: hypothetical protein M1839_005944 [Geoglossum umbratile]